MEERAKVYPQLNQNKSRKGFTLVELIVVLVVIAILAAVAIPALLGYTDEAKEKKAITEAKAALGATQSMMSEAYNDGRNSLSQEVRHQAFLTSGLDADTEFTVWTSETMKKADGTYKTTTSYSIVAAVYKTSDGKYVLYDSNYKDNGRDEWSIVDVDDGIDFVTQHVARTYNNTGAGLSKNVIFVWPYVVADSASGDSYVDHGEGVDNEDHVDDYVDNNDENLDPDNQEKDKEPDNPISLTKEILVQFHVDAEGALTFTSHELEVGTDYIQISYKGGDLEGITYDIAAGYAAPRWKAGSTFYSELYSNPDDTTGESTSVEAFLKDYYQNNEFETEIIEFTAIVDHETVPIPVTFVAVNPDTQDVEALGDGATNVDSASALNDTINLNYDTVNKKIVDTDISDKVSVGVADALNTEDKAAIEPTNLWAVVSDPTSSSATTEPTYYYLDSSVSGDATGGPVIDYVENWINESLENDTISNIQAKGIKFETPADVHKKVFLTVKQKEDNSYITEAKYTATDKIDEQHYEAEYVNNELSTKVYEASDSTTVVYDTSSNGGVVGSYSLIVDEAGLEVSGKVKLWHFKACDFDGSGETPYTAGSGAVEKTREKDCTEEILNNLYEVNNNKYGEVAEIDAGDVTTRLKRVIDTDQADESTPVEDEIEFNTPLKDMFTSIAGGKAENISSVMFIGGYDKETLSSYGYNKGDSNQKQVCLSTTVPKDAGSIDFLGALNENKEIEIDTYDDEYPGFTIAFSKYNSSAKKYDIYVFTEDNTDMVAEGSLKSLHDGSIAMTENTFVNHIETSKVTSMENMFYNCQSLYSKDKGLASTTINLSNLSADSLVSTKNMFFNCRNATGITLGFSNAPNLKDCEAMFKQCKYSATINISGFNTSSVENMKEMFNSCEYITSFGSEDYSIRIDSATDLTSICKNCLALDNITFAGAGMGTVLPIESDNMGAMYSACSALKTVTVKNVATSDVATLKKFFSNASGSVENTYLYKSKAGDGKSLAGVFSGLSKLTLATLDTDSTKNVVDMSSMFSGCIALTSIGEPCIYGLDVSSAKNMSSMFMGCKGLTEASYNKLDMSKAENLSSMFENCTTLDTAVIRIDNATNLSKLFKGCTVATDLTLCGESKDATSAKLTNNSGYSEMFLNIGNNSSSVKSLSITLRDITFPNFLFKNTLPVNLNFNQASSADNKGQNSGLYKMFVSAVSTVDSVTIENVAFPNMYSMDFVFGRDSDSELKYQPAKGFKYLRTVTFNNVDLSDCGRMKGLFMNDANLQNVTFNNVNVDKKMWNFSFMFCNCSSLVNVDFGNLSTAGDNADLYGDFGCMFKDCRSLQTIDGIEKFDTKYVKTMRYMFANCYKLGTGLGKEYGEIDLSSFNTGCIRIDGGEKPSRLGSNNKVTYAIMGLYNMFGTVDDNGNSIANPDASHTSYLKTIYASENFEIPTAVMNDTKYSYMFGEGMTNLQGINGSKLSNVTAKDKHNVYYAWIDGRARNESSDTQGYFTKAQKTKAYVKQMTQNWATGKGLVSANSDIKQFKKYSGNFESVDALLDYLSTNSFKNVDMTQNKADSDGKVYKTYFWFDSTDNTIYWWSEADTICMIDGSKQLFNGWTEVTSIDLRCVDFSNMSKDSPFKSMFGDCKKLTSIKNCSLEGVSANGTLRHMFRNCESLTTIDFLDGFDTSNVTAMDEMFIGCTSLTSIDLSSLNTSSVTTMKDMFNGCAGLTTADLSNSTNDELLYMENMFKDCSSLTSVNLSGFSTPKLTNMVGMFNGCSSLTTIDLSSFNTSKLQTMKSLFENCTSLTVVDISSFTTGSLNSTALRKVFRNCTSLVTIYASPDFNASGVSDSAEMFLECTSLVGGSGTLFSSSHTNKEYARIDGGASSSTPGYFTQKPSNSSSGE